jgi:MFS family permease
VVLQEVLFPEGSPVAQTLGVFALFWVGFLVRPFGAFFFGRIGDLVGRKYTFILTISLMGASTFLIGLLPPFSAIGWLSVALVVLFRVLQGLALGGEYGGRRSTSQNIHQTINAVTTRPTSRPPPRWDWCWRLPW